MPSSAVIDEVLHLDWHPLERFFSNNRPVFGRDGLPCILDDHQRLARRVRSCLRDRTCPKPAVGYGEQHERLGSVES